MFVRRVPFRVLARMGRQQTLGVYIDQNTGLELIILRKVLRNAKKYESSSPSAIKLE